MNIVSWLLLIVLCLLNFLRVSVIDPSLKRSVCTVGGVGSTAADIDSDQFECTMYIILSYASMMMLFLCIFVFFVYYATCKYFDSLIHRSLCMDGIDFNKTGRYGYKRVLETMMIEESRQHDHDNEGAHMFLYNNAIRTETNSNGNSNGNAQQYEDHDRNSTNASGASAGGVSYQPSHDFSMGPKSHRELARSMQDIKTQREDAFSQAEQRRAIERPKHKQSSLWSQLNSFIESFSQPYDDSQLEIRDLFWHQSPWLYFRIVEVSLFLQCLYLALWACQLMPLVHMSEDRVSLTGLWATVLSLPILWNLFLAIQTINKVVLIRSVCGLDREIVGIVCDEQINESRAISDLRFRVRGNLHKGNIPPQQWIKFVHNLFKRYDTDENGYLNKAEFRILLQDVDIFLGNATYTLVWKLIDSDQSNSISWDELYLLLFPELKREIKYNLDISNKIRKEIREKNNLPANRGPENMKLLRLRFDMVDADKSNMLEKNEFKKLLDSLHLKISDRSFAVLLSSLDTENNDGRISWTEFVDLIYPPIQITKIRVIKDSKAIATSSSTTTTMTMANSNSKRKDQSSSSSSAPVVGSKPSFKAPKSPRLVSEATNAQQKPASLQGATVESKDNDNNDDDVAVNDIESQKSNFFRNDSISSLTVPITQQVANRSDTQSAALTSPLPRPPPKPVRKPSIPAASISTADVNENTGFNSESKEKESKRNLPQLNISPADNDSDDGDVDQQQTPSSPLAPTLNPNGITIKLKIPSGVREIGIAVIEDHIDIVDGIPTAHVRVVSFRHQKKRTSIACTNTGLRPDDIICQVNGISYATYQELISAMEQVVTQDATIYLTLSERGEEIDWNHEIKARKQSAKSKKSTHLRKLSVALNKKMNVKGLI